VLATGKVRHVGELVAMCVAPTRAQAEDIAAAVTLDLDELPAERKAQLRLHLNVTATPAPQQGRTISEITGSGPVYEATLKLVHARREIVAIPAKLALSGILGNEANYPQFQRELERLKNAIVYLDRYLADETVVDRDALDDALARILAGEEV
jgi:hypothetical protein